MSEDVRVSLKRSQRRGRRNGIKTDPEKRANHEPTARLRPDDPTWWNLYSQAAEADSLQSKKLDKKGESKKRESCE